MKAQETVSSLRTRLDDTLIELSAVRAQRDELSAAMDNFFIVQRNDGKVPGWIHRLHAAEKRLKVILAQTVQRNDQAKSA